MLITREEYDQLSAVNVIDQLSKAQPEAIMLTHAEEWTRHSKYDYRAWSDRVLIKQLREQVIDKQSCHESIYAEIGEETVGGKICTEQGVFDRDHLADLGYVGPASLLGKVGKELIRRLEEELEKDQRAQLRRWRPPEAPA